MMFHVTPSEKKYFWSDCDNVIQWYPNSVIDNKYLQLVTVCDKRKKTAVSNVVSKASDKRTSSYEKNDRDFTITRRPLLLSAREVLTTVAAID